MITPLMDVDFYNRITARYGQAATDDFLRYFMLPGMGHCSGGVGFSRIGGATGAPLKDDPDHSMVKALDAWVRKDAAPSLFIAAQVKDGKVSATRPVCRYSLEARYLGRSQATEARNFVCRVPEPLPPQPM